MISVQQPPQANVPLTPTQQAMIQVWEDHIKGEFTTHDTDETLATMIEQAEVTHVPVQTGGIGKRALRAFYGQRFIPQLPPDIENVLIARTISDDRIVDEPLVRFTHTVQMDWMLPGIPPTGKRVEIPLVVCVQFQGDKMAAEHIYWDQAGVLAQLGLLDPATLPVVGSEQAHRMVDPTTPMNRLIERADQRR